MSKKYFVKKKYLKLSLKNAKHWPCSQKYTKTKKGTSTNDVIQLGVLSFYFKSKTFQFWFVGTVGGLKQMSGIWVMDILPQFKLYNYLLSFLSVLINVLRTLS